MKIHISVFTALSIMLLGCPNDEPENQIAKLTGDDSNLVVEGFDTSAAISRLSITEKFSRFDLSEESIHNLSDDLDTLELTYYFGFCDCQRWIIDSIHNKAKTTDEKLDDLDPRGQVEFDLNKHGYYIEPASKDLEIDWRTEVNGTTIRFIGREYKGLRLPENGGFTVPDPPPGKVFRYYSYEIIKPYFIWGPRKFIEIDSVSGDSITEPTILNVK
jgi:hypothetical protein